MLTHPQEHQDQQEQHTVDIGNHSDIFSNPTGLSRRRHRHQIAEFRVFCS